MGSCCMPIKSKNNNFIYIDNIEKITNNNIDSNVHKITISDKDISLKPNVDKKVILLKKKTTLLLNDNINEMNERYEKSILEIIKNNNNDCEDLELIENCLKSHFFMSVLENSNIISIIKEMFLCRVKTDTYIYKQGGIGNYYYIIKEGSVELSSNNSTRVINKLEKGQSFGELALLYGDFRVHTAKSLTECYLWTLKRKNFRKIIDQIMNITYQENKKFLENIPIFKNLESEQKNLLCSCFYIEHFEKGKIIVHKDEPAVCLYIVKEGSVNCVLNDSIVRTLKSGDNFGERALLIDSKRSMDAIAVTDCICYSLSFNSLKKLWGENYRNYLYLNIVKIAFAQGKYFKKINVKLLDNALSIFNIVNLSKNQIAFNSNHIKSSQLCVIIDGGLMNETTNKIIANRGDVLFEEDLYNDTKDEISYNIIASPDCLLVKVDTSEFLSTIGKGKSFKEIINEELMINSLLNVQLLKTIPLTKLKILAKNIGIEKYKSGTNIIKEGETGDKFYIIKSGKVDIFVNNKYMRTLNPQEHFGERALFFHEKRSATIKAKEDTIVYFICKNDFENIIDNNLKEFLMDRLYLQDNTIELNDLNFCCELGEGNFGKVCLVKNKKNNHFYAIKILSKNQINCEKMHPNLELEKNILLQIDHPFIVKFVKTLKDKKNIYFLIEYIEGKELFDVIRDIGLVNKVTTQFYAACMFLAVDYLHSKNIIYRDIKPENILVNKIGYLKVIDFGTCKQIADRTYTVIGTPNYMAPEIIMGKGYSFQIDIWSIAICLYEFMCGKVPFGDDEEDPMVIYRAIVKK